MSMHHIKDHDKALAFLKGELAEGTTLARLALTQVDFSRGRMYAWLAPTINPDSIKNFRFSLRLSGDEDREFCRFTSAFIQGPNCGMILQDTEPRNVEDDVSVALAAEYIGELYWHCRDAHVSEGDILNAAGAPYLPYPWCGFFHLSALTTGNRILTAIDLQAIVNTVVGVAVAAFDTGSYLLWWSDNRPLPAGD